MALNMEIIKESKVYYDKKKVMELCNIIRDNDISSDILLNHQVYIIKNNRIGAIQYYSVQGSYFLNQYLRDLIPYKYKNEVLEENIKLIWELINEAPAFDKSYTLYRFIQDDAHLKHLNIGDIYTDPSFISTTRDPFFRSDEYKLGFILIKIKIPPNKKGVALCMETISNFPSEQEIILAPSSLLKLDKRDENAKYYHTSNIEEEQINTRYEFTYVGRKNVSFVDRPIYDRTNVVDIDFLKIDKKDTITMEERIRYFISTYVNPMFQFSTKIGDESYTIITEWYDSIGVYKKFYAATSNNGFSMYTLIDGYIGFIVEIGEDNDGSYMYVNYYYRYSTVPQKKKINDKDLVEIIAKISYYFEIKNVVIYAEYASCDFQDEVANAITGSEPDNKIYYGGNYCLDFYRYLKHKKRKYQDLGIDPVELKPKFSYYELDRLKKLDPLKVLSKNDRDDIYQIYTKTFKIYESKDKHNLLDFYTWLVEHYCVYLDTLVAKMDRVYTKDNPFSQDYYILDSVSYLYNNKFIDSYPVFMDSKTRVPYSEDKKLPKNRYRIDFERKVR
jgi:hypothetical protein